MLYGYGPIILQGALITIELAFLSVIVSILLGLIGASAKLFGNRWIAIITDIYTTLIRGIPDLVLMLLIFYGLQITLNSLTEYVGMSQINIDPFIAGVLTIGFIYGAYFTETFRGAFLVVPKGQIEAGVAYGFSPWQIFRIILFPQMMRFALPGIANNWQVTLKATALVSIIGLADVVKATQNAGKGTYHFFLFTIVAAVVYLFFTTLSNLMLLWLERRYEVGHRKAAL
ncbi:ABC transporter permease [Tolumonas lignilytica]|uniref:ABC transporter permease n=1 Tax=Tolumonas lignilytica TaxID=1283284 RepID=UPI000464B66F|nr:histidine ABC transporter permease HisQ [Tolumonas lignilytica]